MASKLNDVNCWVPDDECNWKDDDDEALTGIDDVGDVNKVNKSLVAMYRSSLSQLEHFSNNLSNEIPLERFIVLMFEWYSDWGRVRLENQTEVINNKNVSIVAVRSIMMTTKWR